MLHTQEDITKEVVKYFQNSYRRNRDIRMEDIIWGIEPFPSMFDEEQNECLFASFTEEELLSVMKSFKKDKSLGPDGWTIDFFIHFFDLMKNDILGMVEESRSTGNIN